MQNYCKSRYNAHRRKTRVVYVGSVGVGGENAIRIQSMTNTPTQDVDATVEQSIALAEEGCEIIRITAPNVKAAQALHDIRKAFSKAGFSHIPLVADIHFLPAAAIEAVEHVEKIRINPGNYADKKKFLVRDYSDFEYEAELERLYKAFSPLVLRAKALGRSLRIGTNHGSLSDRILNRYGDTPLGMAESALEFIRICEHHDFRDIILSMKASNPKVMIQAYRLIVAKMQEHGMDYPLHLGVTEAGDGEDARIKSAIGIGSLLYDGLGDTIRVSLTEDPVREIPVARDLANRAMQLWNKGFHMDPDALVLPSEKIDPYSYARRPVTTTSWGNAMGVGSQDPPRVIVGTSIPLAEYTQIIQSVLKTHHTLRENKVEGLLLPIHDGQDFSFAKAIQKILAPTVPCFVLKINSLIPHEDVLAQDFPENSTWILARTFLEEDREWLARYLDGIIYNNQILAIDASPFAIDAFSNLLQEFPRKDKLIFATTQAVQSMHALGSVRCLAQKLSDLRIESPIWMRFVQDFFVGKSDSFNELDRDANLIEASLFCGPLFCDGLGDMLSIETEPDMIKATSLSYNLLQGARMRSSKTEFVACPSCGRTLFDLETTTQKIREKTGHLKGVTIAVMGCIVNGPGEMADADFGYVGGAPSKVNLYVGKDCVQYNISEERAVEALIALIKSKGKWVEAPVSSSVV